MKPAVAVGCPVRNRAWILPEYLEALLRINYLPDEGHKPILQGIFLVDSSVDDTLPILLEATPESTILICNDAHAPGHRRGEYGRDQYAHLAAVRNRFIELFLSETTSKYLLSVDSDVIVPPHIVEHLVRLADDRTVVAAAISNVEGAALDGRTPGNFLVDVGGLAVHPPAYPLSGVLEVNVVGACALIPRALLEAGVRYAPHPQGEDVPFCQAVRAAGGRCVVTFDVKPEHRMVERRAL